MTAIVDFLPAAYRERTARRRAARERALLAIPVALALLATDLLLRSRIGVLRQMADHARALAAEGELIRDAAQALAQEAEVLQATMDDWCGPLAAQRMTALLDDLVADCPAGVRFRELTVRHDPWAAAVVPTVQLSATCSAPAEFAPFLAALRRSAVLPPVRCQRTEDLGAGDAFAFHLTTDPEAGGSR